MDRRSELNRSDLPTFRTSSRDRILQSAKRLFAGKGYENTSTVAIARAAGTSESQLMKHFGSKEGLLEAIFDEAWQKINGGIRRALETLASPAEKLNVMTGVMVTTLERDSDLKQLMLLEGRRIRKEGRMILASQGFLEFVELVDNVLGQMRAAGQLRPGLNPEAIRSALMGMMEGLLRDQLLGRRAGYPAHYTSEEIRAVFAAAAAFMITATPEQPGRATLA